MYALINNGIVVNVIIANADFAESIKQDYDAVVACGYDVGIGITWSEESGFNIPIPTPVTE